jgi:spore maturation protein CgeB
MIQKVFHIRIDSAPGYRSDAIQKGFIENGFEYRGFNWQHYRYSYGTEILRQEVVKAAKEFNPTIIFAHVQNEEVFDNDTWEKLSDIGFLVNYTFDVRYAEKTEWMYNLAPKIGHTFFACKEDVRNCEVRGIRNISHIHSSCDMDIFKDNEKGLYTFDCSFVGNRYDNTNLNFPLAEERQNMIAILNEKYGDSFMSYGLGQKGNMIIPGVEANVYNFSKIAINQNNFNLHGYTSDRLWRIVSCGSLCLTKYFYGIEDIFEKGVHLDWWKNFDELTERIDFYLSDEKERLAVAKTGMRYVRENHSWKNRIEEIVKICDI